MLITHLHKFLTAPAKKSSPQTIFWFTLSLTFAALYASLALRQAFSTEYVIQDDARQHVFWLRRFLDPQLFPHDLIADYFQSVVPIGYTAFYRLMMLVGIDPVLLSKLLPIGLGLVTSGYCFALCWQLLPVPMAGFIATLLLNQNLWMQDGLVSATPKAFIFPIFLAFLYYLGRRSLPCVCISIILLGLFYPSTALVCLVMFIVQLWHFDRGIKLSKNKSDYIFCATGVAVALIVLLPYALSTSEFGGAITAAQARTLPEFSAQGRVRFFVDDPWAFWLHGNSGIGLATALTPPAIYTGLLLPILLRYGDRFPLVRQINRSIVLLPQLLLASLVMFFAAHALLFKLYHPSRYTQHSLRIVVAIAAGIVLTILLDAAISAVHAKKHQLLTLGSAALIGSAIIFYPNFALKHFPWTYYVVGKSPALYEFLQQQPKNSLIASLSDEADNLPTFAQRPILVGREYSIPNHLGYYNQVRQRILDLIQAQYSPDLIAVQNLIQKYGVDFWLLDQTAFTPEYLASNKWLRQFQPATAEAILQLQQNKTPAIAKQIDRCQVFSQNDFVLLKAECVIEPQK